MQNTATPVVRGNIHPHETLRAHFRLNQNYKVVSEYAIDYKPTFPRYRRLATTFFFKDELHLAPAEVAALSGLFTLPWVFKPLYGFLSDGLPVFGYRRCVFAAPPAT